MDIRSYPKPESPPEECPDDFHLLIGPRGWGKTTFMAALLDGVPRDRIRIISPVSALGAATGLPYIHLRGDDKKSCQLTFGQLLNDHTRYVEALDEFDEYCPGGVTGHSGGYCCRELYDTVNYGRNDPWHIGLIASSRGTADITTNSIRGANYIWIFQATEPNQVEYVRKWIKQGDIDFETIVRNLPKYVALGWEPGNPDGAFTGFWKVIGGRIQEVTPDMPEWEPDWQPTSSPTEPTEDPENPTDPPKTGSTATRPTPGPPSGPKPAPTGGSGAAPPAAAGR